MGPFAIGKTIGIRVSNSRLSAVMKLGFIAQATVGTRNIKHNSSLVGNTGCAVFVNQMPGNKAVEREGPVQFMWGTMCHRMSHDPS